MKRTFTLWLLVFSLVFLALGGLYGDFDQKMKHRDPSWDLLLLDWKSTTRTEGVLGGSHFDPGVIAKPVTSTLP